MFVHKNNIMYLVPTNWGANVWFYAAYSIMSMPPIIRTGYVIGCGNAGRLFYIPARLAGVTITGYIIYI